MKTVSLRRTLVACLLPFSSLIAIGDEVKVSVTNSMIVGNGAVVVPSTVTAGDALPDLGVEPIFWIDSADTNAWEFSEGSSVPRKIPSKTGTRYIKNYAEEGDSLVFNNYPYGAVLTEGGPNSMPYLDFGVHSSGRGYVFNPIADETTGGVSSNVLHNIGTVIAVYGSQNGGGSFALGGGFGKAYDGTMGAGTLWSRGVDKAYEDAQYRYAVGMFSGKVHPSLFWADAYHDGAYSEPSRLGYSGGWEVISLVCTSNDVQASGVGVGNIVYNANIGKFVNAAGGMNIAELIIYDRMLSREERRRVEAYLNRKWFNRTTPGANGVATAGRMRFFKTTVGNTGVQAQLKVGGGEELRVDAFLGGRGTDARATKTGDGVLALGTAGEYGGTVHLAGGTLRMDGAGSVQELPKPQSIYLHLDALAGDEDNMETEMRDGETYVKKWKNLAAGRKSEGNVFYAAQSDPARQPILRYDEKRKAKYVDFGKYVSGGRFFNISTEKAEYSNTAVPYMGTILFVVEWEFGGALLGANNDSGNFGRGSYGTLSGAASSLSTVWSKGYPAKINGVEFNSMCENADTVGLHVLSTQYPGALVCGRLGAYNNAANAGGMKMSEVVIYDHLLTESELKEAEAYLIGKWLKRSRVGLDTPYDINKLVVDAPSVIDIPDPAQTVKVRSLVLNAKLVKKGPGKLVVDATCNVEASGISSHLEVQNGGFAFAETGDVASDASRPPDNAIFHLDANLAETIHTNSSGRISTWRDASAYANMLVHSTGGNTHPILDPDGLGSGKCAVDFGATLGYSGGSMIFARALENVRTLYAVVGNLACGGYFLGVKSRDDANWLDDRNLEEFSRNGTKTIFLHGSGNYTMVNLSELYIDGVKVNYGATVDDGCHLIEIHATGNAYASAIARNAIGNLCGGIKIGEMLAYDRPLTARERMAARNYLKKKWFDGAELEALPEKEAENTGIEFELGEFRPESDGRFDVEGTWKVDRLVGGNPLVKTGDGALHVRDFSDYSGKVTIADGVLKVTGTPASGIPQYIPQREHILFHADAENGPQVITNSATGEQTCKIWMSANGNGWSAVTTNKWNTRPWGFSSAQIFPDSLNGRRTVRFRSYKEGGAMGGMEFMDGQGKVARLENIRSVVWVLGSHDGGGALLGGGASSTADGDHSSFFRNTNSDYTQCILHGNAQKEVKESYWRINGKLKDWSVSKLSGTWETISMVYKEENADSPTSADGFAFLSSLNYREGSGNRFGNTGFQRLAEVIIYDTILSDEELVACEHYLNRKWGLNGFAGEQDKAENFAQIEVAGGATVDLGGTNQYFAAVSGTGNFINGTLATKLLVADKAAESVFALEGTFKVLPGLAVDLRNFSDLPAGVVEVPVLGATALEGEDSLGEASFVSTDGSCDFGRTRLKLKWRDNVLYVVARSGGMSVIVR